jgi:hypothetical protein
MLLRATHLARRADDRSARGAVVGGKTAVVGGRLLQKACGIPKAWLGSRFGSHTQRTLVPDWSVTRSGCSPSGTADNSRPIDMYKALLTLCTTVVLAGCGPSASIPSPTPALSGPAVKALPFTVETVMLSDLFQDELKVGKVAVQVQGGSPDEWVATALAVAEEVGQLGADSIEATVDRSDLEGIDAAPKYLHLAQIYFSPNPKRTVWNDPQMTVMVTPQPATRVEIQRDNEFEALLEKFADQGMEPNSAEEKASPIIAKKFHLPRNWTLYFGGLGEETVLRRGLLQRRPQQRERFARGSGCLHAR